MSEEHLGKYRIEERLGSGTFATVYRCFDPDLAVTCAIKVLAERWSEDESARDWFLSEARVMFEIDHPAIVRVFTSGTLDDGRPFFVMEFANGGSLQDLIQERRESGEPFQIREALDISVSIAQGLAAAHARGVVHRDLKPSNILFQDVPVPASGSGEPDRLQRQIKLADFGLAQRLADGMSVTAGAGTPYYIAPEQAAGQPDTFPDLRSDIYSAATILYELLAGEVPFPYESMTQVVDAHVSEKPRDLGELAPHVPAEIVQLVHAGLEKDPDHRIQDVTIWRDQLQVLRAALNPDGTYTRWNHSAPAAPPPDPLAPPQRSARGDRVTRAVPGNVGTRAGQAEIDWSRVHIPADPVSDVQELHEEPSQARSSNRMRGYIAASLVAGIVIVAFLGFALADLMVGEQGISSDDTGTSDEVVGQAPDEPDEAVAVETPTVEPDDAEAEPEPTSTPEIEEEPEPTATPEATPTPEPDVAVEEVAELLQSLPASSSSVVILPTGDRVEDQPDQQTAAGSTITLWIAATALGEVDNGNLSLDDEYTITSSDQVSGTGILNSSQYLNSTITVEELIEVMIRYSDNSAANILVDLVGGRERVNAYADEHGYQETRLQRNLGVLDPEQENYTSARDTARFMERLVDEDVVDAGSSRRIRELLESRAVDDDLTPDFFGRRLPSGVRFANLSGFIPGVRNETGYFYSESREGIVIASFMVSDLNDSGEAEEPIAQLVARIYETLEDSDHDLTTASQ